MSACLFCQIAHDEAPASVVFRDDVVTMFLDRSPVFLGHVLVVPNSHATTLADLAAADVGPFFERVQRCSAVMPTALGADGTFVAMNNVVSQSVAHLHCHVIPRRRKDGLRGFFWPRLRYDDEAQIDEYRSALNGMLTQ